MAKNDRSKLDALESIRGLLQQVETKRHEKKVAKEMVDEHLEGLEQYKTLQTAKQSVEDAREKLYMFLGSDSDYISLKEGESSAAEDLRFTQEILANEVLAYREEFGQKTVEIDEEMERPIILKATLGKKQEIQLEMDFDNDKKESQQELV